MMFWVSTIRRCDNTPKTVTTILYTPKTRLEGIKDGKVGADPPAQGGSQTGWLEGWPVTRCVIVVGGGWWWLVVVGEKSGKSGKSGKTKRRKGKERVERVESGFHTSPLSITSLM